MNTEKSTLVVVPVNILFLTVQMPIEMIEVFAMLKSD
jgi:hypothetical protein|nr:MAG TPA: hypothetical protein [Caudoviricetes sp.]